MTLPSFSNQPPSMPPTLVMEHDPVADSSSDRVTFAHLLMLIRRRLGVLALVVANAVMLALLVTAASPKTYRAQSTVVLEPRTTAIVPDESNAADTPAMPTRTEEVETQIALISSRTMAGAVFDYLHLADNADFRADVLDPPSAIRNVLSSVGIDRSASPEALGMTAAEFREKGIDHILKGLTVDRVETSFSLQISVDDSRAERAARISNAFAKLYSTDDVRQHSARNQMAANVLGSRLDELRAQANSDFAAVQAFRIRNGLLSQAATGLTEQEISVYNQQIAEARAAASQDASKLSSARSQLARGGAGAVGAAISSPVITSLRTQRAELMTRESDLSSRFLDTFPELVTVRQQIAAIDRQIAGEVSRVVRELEAQASASAQRLSSLQQSKGSARSQLSGDNGALVTLDDLQRQADASKALYQSYLERFNSVVAGSGAEQPNVRIVSLAEAPMLPISPKLALNLIFGLFVGILLGLVAALVAEMSYRGLTTEEDVEERLRLRSLGHVPDTTTVDPHGETPLQTLAEYPDGAFAESLRNLISSINQARSGRGKIIAVTSALPGEGKTTISSSLGVALSMARERVVIVDCDIMRASLTKLWSATAPSMGLREMLESGFDEAALASTTGPTVIPIRMPFAKGERLNEGGRMQALLTELSNRFDVVILDCPPILPIAETREISRLADNVVMVVRWRHTRDKAVLAAARQLPMRLLRDVGVLLNAVDMKKRARFGGSDAAAFYQSYKEYYT